MSFQNQSKRLCAKVDLIREDLSRVIEELGEKSDKKYALEAISLFAEHMKELDAATRDWDYLQTLVKVENTCEDLVWRKNAALFCQTAFHQIGKQIDLVFPEQGLQRKLTSIKARSAYQSHTTTPGDDEALGPLTKSTLLDITIQEPTTKSNVGFKSSASIEPGFSWTLHGNHVLTLNWAKSLKCRLKFASKRLDRLTAVQCWANNGLDNETWPSKYDVLLALEKEARIQYHSLHFSSFHLHSNDQVLSRFLLWLSQVQHGLFSRRCSLSQRSFGLGSVGVDAQLECRPPLRKSEEEDDISLQADLI